MNNDPMSFSQETHDEAERRRRFLQNVSLALTLVSGLALLATVWLAIPSFSLERALAAAATAAVLILNLVSLFMLQGSRAEGLTSKEKPLRLASLLILVSIVPASLVAPLLYAGTGLISGLAAFLFIGLFGDRAFPRRLQNWILVGAVLLVGGAFALDFFGSAARIEPLSTLYQYSVIGVELAVILLYFIRRFGELPFRVKVAGAFILVSVISVMVVAILSVYLSSQALSTAANQALISAANSTARSVDTFITNMRSRVFTEAQIPAIRDFLAIDQPTPAQVEEFGTAIDGLVNLTLATGGQQTNYAAFVRRYVLANESGAVVFDSAGRDLRLNISGEEYFSSAMLLDVPYVSPVRFNRDGSSSLFFSARVKDNNNQVQGVLLIEMDPAVLQQIILDNNNLVGIQSFPILVDDITGLRLAQGTAPARMNRVMTPINMSAVTGFQTDGLLPVGFLQDLASDETELGRVLAANYGAVDNLEFSRGERGEGGAYFGAIATLETRTWRVVYLQTQDYILAPVQTQILFTIGLAVVVALAAAVIAFLIGQLLVRPVINLRNLAQTIAGGDLQVRAPVGVRDEIGTLAESLNSMTDQLQTNISSLEQRVTERTSDLERRNRQLQAAAEIGRFVATIRDQDELLSRSVRLISDRFGFYHAGIFLIDSAGRYAVLSAANSEGGQRMLARGHRLAVGQQGIVGYVTSTGEPRIALDVGIDAVFFNNPDLPTTRSEMALPLRSGGRILGALDVQSTQPQAFSQEDIATLQVLADLLSVTIDNARLFNETELALSSVRQAYGEVSQKAWIERVNTSTLPGGGLGYAATERGISVLGGDSRTMTRPVDTNRAAISLPIRVRDTVIGYVDVIHPETERGEGAAWSEEEQEMVISLVDQLGQALESARLYESSQLQAERERLVGEVAARIQESLDVDAVLRAAAAEIRQALDLADVAITLDPLSTLSAEKSPSADSEEVRA